MLEKLLRLPLPDQIKAVIEKIESLDETSSPNRISNWALNSESTLTRYERWAIKRALRKRARVATLCEAMTLVITPEPTVGEYLTGVVEGEYRVQPRSRFDTTKSTIVSAPGENYDTLSRKFISVFPKCLGRASDHTGL